MRDQQHRVAAEQTERAVHVALVRPLQEMGDDDTALAGQETMLTIKSFGELIDPQHGDRDAPR